MVANKCASMFERISTFHLTIILLVTTGERAPIPSNVGHFGNGHFGLGRFDTDISATDVLATQNVKGGRFGQIINFGLGFVHA